MEKSNLEIININIILKQQAFTVVILLICQSIRKYVIWRMFEKCMREIPAKHTISLSV